MSVDPSALIHRTLAIPTLHAPLRRYTRRDSPVATEYSRISGSYALLFLAPALSLAKVPQTTVFPSAVSWRVVSHAWFTEEKTTLLSATRSPLGLARSIVRIFTSEKTGGRAFPREVPSANARACPPVSQVIELLMYRSKPQP